MKYFKDINNQVYAFESDGSQDDFIPANLTAINQAEADALRAPAPLTAEQNKVKASQLLRETDFVELPSVSDPGEPLYLVNKADFITYRTALRAIAVNPQSGNLTWPTKPSAIWS